MHNAFGDDSKAAFDLKHLPYSCSPMKHEGDGGEQGRKMSSRRLINNSTLSSVDLYNKSQGISKSQVAALPAYPSQYPRVTNVMFSKSYSMAKARSSKGRILIRMKTSKPWYKDYRHSRSEAPLKTMLANQSLTMKCSAPDGTTKRPVAVPANRHSYHTSMDVLLVGGTVSHFGTLLFIDDAKARSVGYAQLSQKVQHMTTLTMINLVKRRGGRFLLREQHLWVEADSYIVQLRVHQCLLALSSQGSDGATLSADVLFTKEAVTHHVGTRNFLSNLGQSRNETSFHLHSGDENIDGGLALAIRQVKDRGGQFLRPTGIGGWKEITDTFEIRYFVNSVFLST